jgi:uncharacterized cupredoxin-like copper-binding protein
MQLNRRLAAAAAIALAGIFLGGAARAAEIETVVMSDADGAMKMAADKADLKAGMVTFNVSNRADSASQHEMIVVKLTPEEIANPDSLPYDDKSATFDEEQVNDRGEVSELDPGKSGSLSVELTPGTYMLVCNVPGHYKAGMYTLVHVS